MTDESDEKVKGLVENLEKKYRRLIEYRASLSWKISQGNIEGAPSFDYDDSSWEAASLPTTWDPAKGEIWLR